MARVFPESTRLWLHKQHVLLAEEDRFRREWGEMLSDVRARFHKKGWLCRPFGNPLDMLQFYKSTWPDGENQVHFEVVCNDHFRRQGIVDLSLHMEADLPNQAEVCGKIRQLLRPHAPKIMRLLAPFSPSLPDHPIHDIMKDSILLTDCDSEVICQALEAMMETETFVDEALYTAAFRPVWQIDFSPSGPTVDLNWFGHVGGQEVIPGVGRFTTPALRIDGTRPNAQRDQKHERGSYCVLIGEKTGVVTNGVEHCVSLVVRARKGGTIWVWCDGHLDDSDGRRTYPMAFRFERSVEPSEEWKHLSWRGFVPTEQELGYDFTKQDTWVVMNVITEDREFLVDSIEIGRCG